MQILAKYLDFLDIFLEKKALILLEITKINQHAIELQEDQQPFYRSIYSPSPIELEILKFTLKPTLLMTLFGL